MPSPDRTAVFVYGTLRRGEVRAIPALFPDARLLGVATVPGRLRDFGAYPGLLLDAAGPGIVGEVYEVSAAVLHAMDEIEGYDPADEGGSYYLRRRVEAAFAGGGTAEAWVYECGPRLRHRGRPIDATDWVAHSRAKGEPRPEAGVARRSIRTSGRPPDAAPPDRA